ncbi:MAG TPA: hypothetical protein VIA62_09460 [Thermoanaerobaculia bacterium]|jgi:hypothetical protein|nr:hypothetical protein [Thermoanaerobaculia bacterium]
MSSNLSIAQVLADLEARIARHEERETFHAGQEGLHRSQRELHAGELARLRERYASFKAAAQAAGEEVGREAALRPALEDAEAGTRSTLSKLVARLIEQKGEDEPFSATALAQEINNRHARRLRSPARVRSVSEALRRLLAEGRVQLVEEGRAFHEAVYRRGSEKARNPA